MEKKKKTLHILVDSREASVTLAKVYYEESNHSLGKVHHFRPDHFAEAVERMSCIAATGDEILISVHFVDENVLKGANSIISKLSFEGITTTVASYDCFSHISTWCDLHDVDFVANTHRKRQAPESLISDSKTNLMCSSVKQQVELMQVRLWIQYRLMLAIISRIDLLGDVCRSLILSKSADGTSLEIEYKLALRYFKLGEPDMAGGSYSCENGSNAIDTLRSRLNKIAATDFNVIISGESGVGKETIAWSIHELSSRRDKPFLAINCAGLPDELLESEMFGYKKGSHNQAYEDTPGFLETVGGGTLFLDELPDMSPRIQAKLLRCLESGEFRPLGGTENRYTNARIIAAGQPSRLASDGLRTDLKSRIGQLSLTVPPLRRMEQESPGTIEKICYVLLERYTWVRTYYENESRELTPYDIKNFQAKLLESNCINVLCKHQWKESNIRELNNFLRQWMVFGDEELNSLKVSSLAGESARHKRRNVLDDALESYLVTPQNRKELKELLALKPLANLKAAYVRHLYKVYSQIVDKENVLADMPKKPTQKELAKLMGVTENTISRHLN